MLEVAYPIIDGQALNEGTQLPQYVLYLFNLGMFVGFFAVFISLVWAGVIYFLSAASAASVDLRADAKDRVTGAISGLLILALTYLIITTINPQLSFLNFNKLPPPPPAPEQKKPSGVYFYQKTGCADDSANANTSSIADLGTALRNKINSVGFLQDTASQTYYVPILYDAINFQGMCRYLNPNQACQNVAPFATTSASIFKYDTNPNGDGVYFYRKSYFNEKGGSYKVNNSEIKGIYIQKLENLKFQGVPENEQDCTAFDKNGECSQNSRRPPSLSGENISSVKIKGNYIVLFVYSGPQDNSAGPWTYCQEFPTVDDVNKLGPQQIKWENIRNHGKVVPNYVAIIPIQK